MTRRKLVIGNWKMNGSQAALGELTKISAAITFQVELGMALPATLIAGAVLTAPNLAIGGQDAHAADDGSYTGCISVPMLREAGASFCIVGHSERRINIYETDSMTKAKAEALHRHGLRAILCVGETQEQRTSGQAETMVTEQLAASLPDGAAASWLSIAYEPIWAIGTGRTPTPADIATMHEAIRRKLRILIGADAELIRILYGGSVTADNVAALLRIPHVDGALVGGASLAAARFLPVIAACAFY